MNKLNSKNTFYLIVFLFIGSVFTSCKTTENATYFSNLDSLKTNQISLAEFKEPLIQTDDILDVNVQTMGQNAFASSTSTTGAASQLTAAGSGFLVSKAGTIEMPMLGVIKLAGLTTSQAIEVIRTAAAKYYKDPTVQVRFANFRITVLGEVGHPSSFTVPSEKVTVLDAISLAGDLTITGKRNNILLMRDNGNKKEVVRLNLNSTELVNSPYFYLRQNDVLYVEPTKIKVANSNARNTQLITVGITAASFLLTLVNVFR
ncbi:MAG: polysaccharide biosynthesis/export family protein [Bacteroidota bacterium]